MIDLTPHNDKLLDKNIFLKYIIVYSLINDTLNLILVISKYDDIFTDLREINKVLISYCIISLLITIYTIISFFRSSISKFIFYVNFIKIYQTLIAFHLILDNIFITYQTYLFY